MLNNWVSQKRHVGKYELIALPESAKLPVYLFKRKLGTQPLIRSIRFSSPGAELGSSKAESGCP